MNGNLKDEEKLLVARIEVLERRLRLQQRVGACVLVALCGMTLLAMRSGNSVSAQGVTGKVAAFTVEAREFVLKDGDGKVRAKLSNWEGFSSPSSGRALSSRMQPRLAFFQGDGKKSLELGIDVEEEVFLRMDDNQGSEVRLKASTGAQLALLGPQRQEVSLLIDREGKSRIILASAEGNARLFAGVDAEGRPRIEMRDEEGKLRSNLGSTQHVGWGGTPAEWSKGAPPYGLVILGEDGATQATVP